jgi:hypothetical protein
MRDSAGHPRLKLRHVRDGDGSIPVRGRGSARRLLACPWELWTGSARTRTHASSRQAFRRRPSTWARRTLRRPRRTGPLVSIHESRMTSVYSGTGIQHGPCRVGRSRLGARYGSWHGVSLSAVSVPREILRPRAANRDTHSSRPRRQARVARYVNGQVRARLMVCPKSLRCRRTDARKS